MVTMPAWVGSIATTTTVPTTADTANAMVVVTRKSTYFTNFDANFDFETIFTIFWNFLCRYDDYGYGGYKKYDDDYGYGGYKKYDDEYEEKYYDEPEYEEKYYDEPEYEEKYYDEPEYEEKYYDEPKYEEYEGKYD